MKPLAKRAFGWRASAAIVGGFGLLLGGLFAPAAHPAERKVSTKVSGNLPPANLRIADGKILLTLEEAVDIALERNLGLVINRYTRETFRLGIQGAKGIFDFRIGADVDYSDEESPTSSQLEGASVLTSQGEHWNLDLAQLDPWGGEAALHFHNGRTDSNNRFADINPRYNSTTQITYDLHLLRGFGPEVAQQTVRIARLQAASNREAFETQLVDLVERTENAYWDLVEALDQLQVARESLSLAEELHRRNRIQVDVGTKPPLELVQSEANIAIRREGIITAETALGNANDALRLLLNIEQGPAWDAEIVPETNPKTAAIQVDLPSSIQTALANRPELAEQRIEIDRLALLARVAKNATLPQLDLSLGYTLSGVGGTSLLRDDSGVILETFPGGWSDALDQITRTDFPTWLVGLTFSYPLQNRAARAESATATVNLESGKVELNQLQQQVITDVRSSARQVTAAAQQIESAGASRVLQERNLDAQQKRYENGMSTSFEVTQVQEDLTLAKSREVTAIASYRRALAAYHRALGQLLTVNGIEIDDPAGNPPPKACSWCFP